MANIWKTTVLCSGKRGYYAPRVGKKKILLPSAPPSDKKFSLETYLWFSSVARLEDYGNVAGVGSGTSDDDDVLAGSAAATRRRSSGDHHVTRKVRMSRFMKEKKKNAL